MKTVYGDLIRLALKGEFDVIIHGCNCFNTMGAGIAKAIRAEFPEAYEADHLTRKGDSGKLGTVSTAQVSRDDNVITIVNAYTQYDWRGKGCKVDYDAIAACFKIISDKFGNCRIGYPQIGAGLAGGDWKKIAGFIESELGDADHTLVLFQP